MTDGLLREDVLLQLITVTCHRILPQFSESQWAKLNYSLHSLPGDIKGGAEVIFSTRCFHYNQPLCALVQAWLYKYLPLTTKQGLISYISTCGVDLVAHPRSVVDLRQFHHLHYEVTLDYTRWCISLTLGMKWTTSFAFLPTPKERSQRKAKVLKISRLFWPWKQGARWV